MKRVLKNPLRQHIKGFFRGRDVIFKSKTGLEFDMEDEEERALFNYWKETYQFLYELEPKGVVKNDTEKHIR